MTERELRLRARIDQLTDERDQLRERVKLRVARGRPRWCVYCGGVCYGRACVAHRDLLNHDPHYKFSSAPAATALDGSFRGGRRRSVDHE